MLTSWAGSAEIDRGGMCVGCVRPVDRALLKLVKGCGRTRERLVASVAMERTSLRSIQPVLALDVTAQRTSYLLHDELCVWMWDLKLLG